LTGEQPGDYGVRAFLVCTLSAEKALPDKNILEIKTNHTVSGRLADTA
jgi:hypothetical protein